MLDGESLITLAEAAKLRPGRPHVSSIWRQARVGVRARNGDRVRLEHKRIAGKIWTSREALSRFDRALAEADAEHFDEKYGAESDRRVSARSRSERATTSAVSRAERRMAAAGI
ncbi:MAG: DUF1580 domain-containing protein [Phycisphaerales bacterium]